MSIRVIDDPEIVITQAQHDMYKREWERLCMYHANPPSFEAYVRRQQGLAVPETEVKP